MNSADIIQLLIAILILLQLVFGSITVWAGYKASQIGQLEKRLAAKNEESINQKFATAAAEFKLPLAELRLTNEQMRERLRQGDGTFEQQGERAQRIELAMNNLVAELRQECTEQFCTNQDLDKMDTRLRHVEGQMARVEAKVEAKVNL